jgi:hypothetical protein
MFKKIYLILIIAMFLGCATVPKESVTLSATVGRDLQEMQRSHLALVDLYFNGLIEDINRFIDDVYLPYQIKMTLSDEFWKEEMLSAIELASLDNSDSEIQKESFQKIQIFIQSIQSEVEYYRNLKLSPIEAQYEEIVHSINTSYEQIHYANSIVTGHLASVVKVHDTQNELL